MSNVETTASSTLVAEDRPQSATREELFDLVWSEPMLRVADRFGVSSSYLARVCTELRVPRPARGYWAKLEFGRSPPKPVLPPARPGDLMEWSPGLSVGTTVRSIARATRFAAEEAPTEAAGNNNSDDGVASGPKGGKKQRTSAAESGRHELLVGVKSHFLKTRQTENEILRPFKRLLVDVLSSAALLDAVLEEAQFLFEAFGRKGCRVGYATAGQHMQRHAVDLLEKPTNRTYHRTMWTPDRATVVYVDGVAIGITLFEMTEEVETVYVNGKYLPVKGLTEVQLRRYSGIHHWRSSQEKPSGRICLQAYCPSGSVKWSKRWQETERNSFRRLVPSIVAEIKGIAPTLAKQLEEARLQWQEQQRRWQEERRQEEIRAEQKRREKATEESRRELMAAISAWEEARRVHEYFKSVDAAISQLPEDEGRDHLQERLRLAQELVGHLDPLGQLRRWKDPDEWLLTLPKYW